MYIFQKEQNDLVLINSDNNSIRFLRKEEKDLVYSSYPRFFCEETRSIAVYDLPIGFIVENRLQL